jgi:hypothetical protein
MMRNGECWALSTPAHRTSESASGLWPTPCANETGENPENLMERMKKYGRTGSQVHMKLSTKVQMWATPQARDFRTGQQSRWENPERTRNLNDQIGGQLNPTWVEWLMGWPLGWTDCAASVTGKFQQWRRSHGESSTL